MLVPHVFMTVLRPSVVQVTLRVSSTQLGETIRTGRRVHHECDDRLRFLRTGIWVPNREHSESNLHPAVARIGRARLPIALSRGSDETRTSGRREGCPGRREDTHGPAQAVRQLQDGLVQGQSLQRASKTVRTDHRADMSARARRENEVGVVTCAGGYLEVEQANPIE